MNRKQAKIWAEIASKITPEQLEDISHNNITKHIKEIKAYSQGADIEYSDPNFNTWVAITDPNFFCNDKYRVKPLTLEQAAKAYANNTFIASSQSVEVAFLAGAEFINSINKESELN